MLLVSRRISLLNTGLYRKLLSFFKKNIFEFARWFYLWTFIDSRIFNLPEIAAKCTSPLSIIILLKCRRALCFVKMYIYCVLVDYKESLERLFELVFDSTWEEYPEPCQTSKIELCTKMVYGFWPLTIFASSFILDVWLGSEYASQYHVSHWNTSSNWTIKTYKELS